MGFKKEFYSTLRQMKKVCSRTPGLRWIPRLKAVRSLNTIFRKQDPNILEQFDLFDQCYEQHREEFSTLSRMLADDFSRLTLEKLIACRRTGKVAPLKDVCVEPQYFQKDIFKPLRDEVFVDGGAYIGDTIENFVTYCGGGI